MLETTDLILRPGSPEDWEALYHNLWRHPSVFHYLFSKPCATPDAAQKKTAAYAEMHRDVPTEFFVIHKHTNQAIGIACIKELSPGI